MIKEGLINEPPMFQICLGIPWGAEQTVIHEGNER